MLAAANFADSLAASVTDTADFIAFAVANQTGLLPAPVADGTN